MWAPSAEFVRRIAESEAKTLYRPVPNFETPCLPEPELELPPDNPFFEALERFKQRGKIPSDQAVDAAREIVRSVMGRLSVEKGKSVS